MTSIIEAIRRLLVPPLPLSAGIFHYQSPPDTQSPYRLHLRLEPDGSGLLIVNASTILHLNQTAAEYAYHLIKQTPIDQMALEMTRRYRINRLKAQEDFGVFKERMDSLINTPDLDPETYLDFERTAPYTHKISAPYRLDCAITYRLSGLSDETIAPSMRVSRELSSEEWFTIFDNAWEFGIPHIILTGGEPTLRDDLPALIAHTESNGQVVGLLSDGLKLVDHGYLQTLLQTGLDHLMLLLKPDAPQSWKALESALSADLFVVTHLTLTKDNVMEISRILTRILSMDGKTISLSASDPTLHDSLIKYRNEAASMGLSLVWDLPVPYSEFNPVSLETQVDHSISAAGHAFLYVEPDGDVLPEQGVNHVLGNLLKDPWKSVWH